ncbi:hypothetical protein BDQ94DRAFT_135554 [Aspergillus welwitschiae]|uniref:Uncharacterized protein n=1 Tax=Aspergillus welwitschiae TaxID=1341132 RepID=A0A3F3QGI6_9EURO|nr:hypothetical protein BDQ94DRAFT_135554 [Aspergillus welwitschiae]RDH38032.1 hypothetical protein BDQ94DRAFT_135554 [Aspergillus welwitschiae]
MAMKPTKSATLDHALVFVFPLNILKKAQLNISHNVIVHIPTKLTSNASNLFLHCEG